MSVFKAPVRYFLGSMTPHGYVGTEHTLYDPQDGWYAYLLKGGAGTGKSTLLRRLYTAVGTEDPLAEVFCCSSDPSSLDAVRFPARKIAVLDATAPHVVEPQYWGAAEQPLPLFQCLDRRVLQPLLPALIDLFREKRELFEKARQQLSAAAALIADNRRIEQDNIDFGKIDRLARRLAQTEWDAETESGTCAVRFLSAVTPEGLLTFYDTVQALCPRIYVIEDEYGTAARYLLQRLQTAALSEGKTCIACPSPLFPQDGPEHLLLPASGVAFLTSNSLHKVDFPVYRRIHASRFIDTAYIQRKRHRLSFCRRAAADAIAEAVNLLEAASFVHRTIEAHYGTAMNWDTYHALSDSLISAL